MYYVCDTYVLRTYVTYVAHNYLAYVFEISATTPTIRTVSHIMINIYFYVVNSIIKLMKLAIGSQGLKCEIYILH